MLLLSSAFFRFLKLYFQHLQCFLNKPNAFLVTPYLRVTGAFWISLYLQMLPCVLLSVTWLFVFCASTNTHHQGLFALFFTFPSGSRWFCSFSFSSHAVTQKRFCSLDLYVCCLTRYSSRDGGGLGKCACLGSLHCWARSNLRHFWWQMVADLHLCWCISPLTAWLWYLYIWGLQIVRNNSKISVSH